MAKQQLLRSSMTHQSVPASNGLAGFSCDRIHEKNQQAKLPSTLTTKVRENVNLRFEMIVLQQNVLNIFVLGEYEENLVDKNIVRNQNLI